MVPLASSTRMHSFRRRDLVTARFVVVVWARSLQLCAKRKCGGHSLNCSFKSNRQTISKLSHSLNL